MDPMTLATMTPALTLEERPERGEGTGDVATAGETSLLVLDGVVLVLDACVLGEVEVILRVVVAVIVAGTFVEDSSDFKIKN